VMGFQIGTGVSQLFDPQIGAASSEMGRLVTALVGLAVVVAGGHNLMVRGLLTSFVEMPAGGQWLDPDLALTASRLMGGMLLAGCEMAVPVVAVTMLSTFAIALSVRATPQLNI
ncbi:MAG: flagellar biosynthetic protein FliR, partial [Myxococcota bacterium]|nr:flagellar biosynthetic protein FliR [Myxococcota bacterium]